MTTHEILLNNQFQGFSGFFQKRVIDFGLRLISCTMAVSDDAKNNLKEFFPFFKKGKKLIVIKNGIDVKRFSTSSARNFYQELNLSDNFILFGFFGRFMNAKGFRYLVEAVQELKAQEVVNNIRVIAFGWGGFIREEQEYIRDLGLEDYFLFMPHTDDMPAAIRGVDAVVIPSLWEACPMLPMEVMVSGIPVIASDCIGLREVTAETPALVFQHGNAIELAAVMQRYIDEASQCHEDSLAYSTTAVGRYDVAITASELCAQYRLMM
jgi:glycosyltransferase involved in cell wall biosynthesis